MRNTDLYQLEYDLTPGYPSAFRLHSGVGLSTCLLATAALLRMGGYAGVLYWQQIPGLPGGILPWDVRGWSSGFLH